MTVSSIMPNERSQTQKAAHRVMPCKCHSGKGETIMMEIRSAVTRDYGSGEGIDDTGGMRELFGVMELFCILIMASDP